MKTILDIIGAPAALEQCAEECSELTQACLKLARKLRGENPTPKDESALYASLEEEIADVELCTEVLRDVLREYYDEEPNFAVNRWIDGCKLEKLDRWYKRLEEK